MDVLSPATGKRCWSVEENVQALVKTAGLERCGFLTLTFKGGCPDIREAQKRFNNFATGVLRPMFGPWVAVVERHLKGGVHFHLVVDCKRDIRTAASGEGIIDFDALKRRDYRTANRNLREMWASLRSAQRRYGFGERAVELLPVRVSGKAVGRYCAKYLTKHLQNRRSSDRRKKLVRYSKGANRFRQQISWATPGAALWRAKTGAVARACGGHAQDWALGRLMGPRWAFRLRPVLCSMTAYEEPGRAPEFHDDEIRAAFDVVQLERIRRERRQKPKEGGQTWGWMQVTPRTFETLGRAGEAFLHSFKERTVGLILDLTSAAAPDEWWEVEVIRCHENEDGEGYTLKVKARLRVSKQDVSASILTS